MCNRLLHIVVRFFKRKCVEKVGVVPFREPYPPELAGSSFRQTPPKQTANNRKIPASMGQKSGGNMSYVVCVRVRPEHLMCSSATLWVRCAVCEYPSAGSCQKNSRLEREKKQ